MYLLLITFFFLDKDQIIDNNEQSDSFSPTRQTEAFIISETDDDSRTGKFIELLENILTYNILKIFVFCHQF